MVETVRTLDARSWLPALGAALALSGHGPWFMVPLWFVGFLAVRASERARLSGAALPFVLALPGSLAALPELEAWVASYAQLAFAGLAAHFALNLIEERRRAGLGLLALVWLCAPTPLGVAGLVAGGVALGWNTQRGARAHDERRALWAMAGLALILTLGAALLPRPPANLLSGVFQNGQNRTAGARENKSPTPAHPRAPSGRGASPAISAGAPLSVPARAVSVLNALPALFLSATLAALSVFMALVLRLCARLQRGERLHWSDLIVPAALVIGLVMVVAYALLSNGAGESGAAPSNPAANLGAGGAQGQGRRAASSLLSWALSALSWALFSLGAGGLALLTAGILGGILLLLRYRPRDEREGRAAVPATAPGDEEPTSLHRVRLAYRQMLDALPAANLGRRGNETPWELAARVGAARPSVSADLLALTRLYQPVRYGQAISQEHASQEHASQEHVSETHAEQAEERAARIVARLGAPPEHEEPISKENV